MCRVEYPGVLVSEVPQMQLSDIRCAFNTPVSTGYVTHEHSTVLKEVQSTLMVGAFKRSLR